MKKSGLALAATAVALTVPAAACAQAIVVRANGPSAAKFPRGAKLDDGAKVTLQAGDSLIVLDRAGSRVLKGKGSYTIDSKVARDRSAVGMLSRSLNNPTSVRAGAVRGVPLPDERPALPKSAWLADIDKGGKVCVPQGSGFYLWRTASDQRRMAWLGEAEGGAMVRVQFPIGTSGVAWPSASLPLVPGRSYRITEDANGEKPVDFELVSLAPDAVPDNAADLGALLLANGCTVQFDLLADALAESEDAGA